MYTSKSNYRTSYAGSESLGVRRLKRRIDFFFWIRRNSLLETNHRFRRTVLKIPLFATILRKRFSSWSCDSFGRKFTDVNLLTSFRRASKDYQPLGRKNLADAHDHCQARSGPSLRSILYSYKSSPHHLPVKCSVRSVNVTQIIMQQITSVN